MQAENFEEITSFNPCFNGSCSRILDTIAKKYGLFVSILVLMDLAHEFYRVFHQPIRSNCFNPCFNGSCSRIISKIFYPTIGTRVSILVLMDLAHESDVYYYMHTLNSVSILVLMDLAHEFDNIPLVYKCGWVSILVLMDLAHE